MEINACTTNVQPLANLMFLLYAAIIR